jgi:hypothetical protein
MMAEIWEGGSERVTRRQLVELDVVFHGDSVTLLFSPSQWTSYACVLSTSNPT